MNTEITFVKISVFSANKSFIILEIQNPQHVLFPRGVFPETNTFDCPEKMNHIGSVEHIEL